MHDDNRINQQASLSSNLGVHGDSLTILETERPEVAPRWVARTHTFAELRELFDDPERDIVAALMDEIERLRTLLACPWCGCRVQHTDPAGTCANKECRLPWQYKDFLPGVHRLPHETESVPRSVYEQAVQGRRDFRAAYRTCRDLLQKFADAWEGKPGHENMDRLCELVRTNPMHAEEKLVETSGVSVNYVCRDCGSTRTMPDVTRS